MFAKEKKKSYDNHHLHNEILLIILKNMKPINISSLIKKYGPGYIAKNKKTGKVVAHAKRLDLLFTKTKSKTDIIISWVPKKGARYVC